MTSATTLPTPGSADADPELVARIFRTMACSRALEEAMKIHLAKQRFDGWWHPGEGQEAAQAGAAAALATDDYLFYQGRGVAWALGKGMDLDRIFGDLFARTTGATRGKGAGVPHWADPGIGLMGEGATLGSVFPLAGGAALAEWIRGGSRVALADFGDGTAARGTFHETLLEAAAWKLPVIFYCENNAVSVNEPFAAHSPTGTVAERAAAYGVPGVLVDGQDALAVYAAVAEAVRRARNGEGPTVIEARTFRVGPHAFGVPTPADREDLTGYRDPLGGARRADAGGPGGHDPYRGAGAGSGCLRPCARGPRRRSGGPRPGRLHPLRAARRTRSRGARDGPNALRPGGRHGDRGGDATGSGGLPVRTGHRQRWVVRGRAGSCGGVRQPPCAQHRHHRSLHVRRGRRSGPRRRPAGAPTGLRWVHPDRGRRGLSQVRQVERDARRGLRLDRRRHHRADRAQRWIRA